MMMTIKPAESRFSSRSVHTHTHTYPWPPNPLEKKNNSENLNIQNCREGGGRDVMMPPGFYSDIERPKVNKKKKMMNMSGPIRKKLKEKKERKKNETKQKLERELKGSLLPSPSSSNAKSHDLFLLPSGA